MNKPLRLSPSVSNKQLHKRRFFWVWHRRLGLAALALVAVLSVTGIMLNHTEMLHLDEQPVSNHLLLHWYGFKQPSITSYPLETDWFSQLGDSLYINSTAAAPCTGTFTGLTQQAGIVIASCNNELLLFSPERDFIERIGSQHQLPQPVLQLGYCDQQPCINTGTERYLLDIEQLQWQPVTNTNTAQWSQPNAVPVELNTTLTAQYHGSDLHWERVILDLHSGRILGTAGVIIMDLAAVILLILGLSGFWLWWSGPGRR